jgi:YVTN family beta-propeller protein
MPIARTSIFLALLGGLVVVVMLAQASAATVERIASEVGPASPFAGGPAGQAPGAPSSAVPPALTERPPLPRFSYPANGTIPIGGEPWAIAFDEGTDQMFVVNVGDQNVSVLSAVTYAQVVSVDVGEAPFADVVDPAQDTVLVTNYDSDNVSVISTGTDTVVQSIDVGSDPSGIAYDAAMQEFYVANFASGNVSVISDTWHVVASIDVGDDPEGVTYDAALDEVFVTNAGAGTVSVIDGETLTVVRNIAVGDGPVDAAYDPIDGDVYVTNIDSDNVSIVDTSTDRTVGAVPTGTAPEGITFEPRFGELLVANLGDYNLSVIYGAAVIGSIPVGGGPGYIAYDNLSQQLWVTDAGVGNLTILNDTTPAVQVQLWDSSFWGGGACPGTVIPSPSTPPTFTEYFLDVASPGDSWSPFDTTEFSATFSATLNVPSSGVYGFQLSSSAGSALYLDGRLALDTPDGTCSAGGTVTASIGLTAGAHQLRVYYYWVPPFGSSLDLLWQPPGTSGYVTMPSAGFTFAADLPIPVGSAPGTPLYADGQIFVPDADSSSLTVVSGASQQVVANLSVGTDPQTPVYDPSSGLVFVPNSGSNDVSVVNASNDTVVGVIPVGIGPETGVFDAKTGDIYVPNAGSASLSVLSGTGAGVLTTVPVGTDPETPALDPLNAALYVPNNGSGTVSVVGTAGPTVVTTVPVGTEPGPPVFDPQDREVYVPNYGSDNVSVVLASTNHVVATIDVGSSPFAPAPGSPPVDLFSRTTKPAGAPVIDPANGQVYVTNADSDNVSVINASQNQVVAAVAVGSGPQAPVLDPADGNLYVANNGSGNVSVISGSTATVVATVDTGAGPASPVLDNATGSLYVPDAAADTLTVVSSSYYLTFEETGLPSGAAWQVVVTGSSGSTTDLFSRTTAPVALGNGTDRYVIFGPHGYDVTGAVAPAGTVTIDGTDRVEQVTFAPGPTWSVVFHATGLPKATAWCVALGVIGCSTTSAVTFANVTPYSYPYAPVPLPGYVPHVGKGGRAYTPPPDGVVNVTTHSASVKIAFKVATYALSFVATGLAKGKSWSVQVNWTADGKPHRVTAHSAHATIVVEVPNGTVTFRVGTVKGYSGGGYTSTVVIDGAAVQQNVTYAET